MTDNAKFKEDATKLLNLLISFKRKYVTYNKSIKETGADIFEHDLRMMLKIVRTDEENKQQQQEDSYY